MRGRFFVGRTSHTPLGKHNQQVRNIVYWDAVVEEAKNRKSVAVERKR
jgi:hypothetical protein